MHNAARQQKWNSESVDFALIFCPFGTGIPAMVTSIFFNKEYIFVHSVLIIRNQYCPS